MCNNVGDISTSKHVSGPSFKRFVLLFALVSLAVTIFRAAKNGSVSSVCWRLSVLVETAVCPLAPFLLLLSYGEIGQSLAELVGSIFQKGGSHTKRKQKACCPRWVAHVRDCLLTCLAVVTLGAYHLWAESIPLPEASNNVRGSLVAVTINGFAVFLGKMALCLPVLVLASQKHVTLNAHAAWTDDLQAVIVSARSRAKEVKFQLQQLRIKRTAMRQGVQRTFDSMGALTLTLIAATSMQQCLLTYLTIQDVKNYVITGVHFGLILGVPVVMVTHLTFSLGWFVSIAVVADACHRMQECEIESLRTIRNLESSHMDPSAHAQLMQLILEHGKDQTDFSPKGLFQLNRGMITGLTNAMATYLVVLVQMNWSDTKGSNLF